jgi:hypothetical protein
MSEIKRIDIKEFREKGYLFEANRKFFHPLGLALEINIDEDGNESLGGVWDYRDDPEGMLYNDSIMSSEAAKTKFDFVATQFEEKAKYRLEKYGFAIQPIKSQ